MTEIKNQNIKTRILNLEFKYSNLFRISNFEFRIFAKREGFGLIEIVVAIAIVTSLIFALGQVMQLSLRLLREERLTMEAALLLQEGIEGMRVLRGASWLENIAPLVVGTDYYLTATSTWGIWVTPQLPINGRYARVIRLDSVNRESGTDRIVSAGGYADSGTRKVTVTVSWMESAGTSSISAVTYLTNFLQN